MVSYLSISLDNDTVKWHFYDGSRRQKSLIKIFVYKLELAISFESNLVNHDI